MALDINLAQSGFVGVIGLTAGELSSLNDNQVIAVNSVYALTGDTDFSIELPEPNATDVWEGSVVIFKHLADAGVTITFTRQNDLRIDGVIPDVEAFTDIPGEVISFYYINERIGWLAGPAVTI